MNFKQEVVVSVLFYSLNRDKNSGQPSQLKTVSGLKFKAFFQLNMIHYTEVRFAGFFSGGFITAIVVNPPERRLAKRTSVHCRGSFALFLHK